MLQEFKVGGGVEMDESNCFAATGPSEAVICKTPRPPAGNIRAPMESTPFVGANQLA